MARHVRSDSRWASPACQLTPPTKRWWRRALAAAGAMAGLAGLTVLAGPTLASFVDGEYGAMDHSAGVHNLQISLDGQDWHETSLDGLPDNQADTGVLTPLTLTGSTWIVPGDPITGHTVQFQVRNDPNSTANSQMIFRLFAQPGSDAEALAVLRFDIDLDGVSQGTGLQYTDLTTGAVPMVIDDEATPGTSHRLTLKATIPDQGSRAANDALADKSADLLLAVLGTSVLPEP
ncbi:MAG: hypothetical protein LBR19_09740 [Bifidobacteriaceae bacterium]|nr:hypothetical protein [Bifidobacteriaceae bacterium]